MKKLIFIILCFSVINYKVLIVEEITDYMPVLYEEEIVEQEKVEYKSNQED